MTTQRFDIEVQDRVAKSIRTEITGIGTAARTTFSALQAMKAEMAGLSSATGRMGAGASTIREQASEARNATSAARAEAAAIRDVTNALREQATAARALASARRAGGGVAPSPGAAPAPVAPVVRRFTGGGGGGGGFGANTAQVRELGAAAQMSSHHMANLVFQLNDVFVSLASGQKPLTVAIQQGSQIGQIGMQTGMSWRQMGGHMLTAMGIIKRTTDATAAADLAAATMAARSVASASAVAASNVIAADTELALAVAQQATATTATETAAAELRLTAAHEAIAIAATEAAIAENALAVAQGRQAAAASNASSLTVTSLGRVGRGGLIAAAAIAVLAGTMAVLNREINNSTGREELTRGLNLTAREMRHLDDVTVTWGDTAKAIFQVAGRAIWGQVGGAVTTVWNWMKEWIDWIGSGVRTGVNYLIGGFVGAYRVILATWRQFPRALGDIFVQGVNAAISAINDLISAAVNGVNGFIEQANTILPEAMQIGTIAAPQIALMENQWDGALNRMGDTARAALGDAFSRDYVGEAYGAIRDQAVRNAQDRLRRQAEEAGYLDPSAGRRGRHGRSEAERRADEMAKVNRELDAQIALMAFYGPALERENKFLTIRNALLDKHITLTAAEEASIRSRIQLIQDGERAQARATQIEEAANGPRRDYEATLTAINIALRDNVISEDEAHRQRVLAANSLTRDSNPIYDYVEQLAQAQRNMGLYGRELSIQTRAQQLFNDAVAAGQASLTSQDDRRTAANDAREEANRGDINSAFAAIDPRERQDPQSSSYLLDHHREMYAEIARLREEDVISEQEAAIRKQNLDRAYLDARLEGASTVLGQLSALQSSKNKEVAALGKAAAIAQATIDGYRAVQAALAGPPGPPWSFAIAGVTAAMTVANVARISGVGFMAGGFTGNGSNTDVAGPVHRNEYVFDASATRRIGVPALEAMRRGTLTQAPANDNRGGGNVIIRPMPGVYVEERRTSTGEIELIAARVARRVAPDAVAKDIKGNANSPTSKALGGAYGLKRADR